jgi:probable phosphomutase (TIGR03848 family)
VTTVLLIRHGRSTANTDGTLAGWTPGVDLDDAGREQVASLAGRLSSLPLAGVVTSPLERCRQTTEAVVADRDIDVFVEPDVAEVHYGDWTGESLKQLAKQPLWKVVQQHPSAARFPGSDGESLAAMQHRAVSAVRRWNNTLGDGSTYAVVSHGDVIKALVADALGLHLDLFQRIVVIRYGTTRPFVERLNDTGGDIAALMPPRRKRRRTKTADDAVVGGGAGAASPKPRRRSS